MNPILDLLRLRPRAALVAPIILALPMLVDSSCADEDGGGPQVEPESADETIYADKPYWYKPGHPLEPAEAATVEALPGFVVERVLTVPREFGSWSALAAEPGGTLIASAQHEPGLFRITPARSDGARSESGTKVERLGGAAARFGRAQGLLHAFGSLFVTVAENADEDGGEQAPETGLYRLDDHDGDGEFDEVTCLMELDGSGEHGPHGIAAGPDGGSIYLMCGNGTAVPERLRRTRLSRPTDGVDHLMPPGFESSQFSTGGWVVRMEPDGRDAVLVASGLRNSYDLAFSEGGDLFTFDSDMEWDLGTPWYRPTRVCHLVSGAEFGWRGGAAKWPDYYEDSCAAVADIGPGSPTGVVFGTGAAFPPRYQRALFVADWTFATIHAVHLEPDGAGFRAEVEEFVGGRGLPITDLVVGGDGALYFTVGGRRLGSALYRVRYTGARVEAVGDDGWYEETRALHRLRARLESIRGVSGGSWPLLGHEDRAIRIAARVALEGQPVAAWRERALGETDTRVALGALLALSRRDAPEQQGAVLDRLGELGWNRLSAVDKLRFLRVHELALARGEDHMAGRRAGVRARLRPFFPDGDRRVDRELARMLCFLGDPTATGVALDLMEADTGERPPLGSGYFTRNSKYGVAVRNMLESAPLLERMHHAQMLLWTAEEWSAAERRRYFELVADAMANSKGGYQYLETWNRIREAALDAAPEGERAELESIAAPPAVGALLAVDVEPPAGPGRKWSVDEAVEVAGDGFADVDRERGRELFIATGCAACHRIGNEGGAIGPDLSGLGQRFTVRDIIEATIDPNRAVSDQFRMATLELRDGGALSGRIVSRDATTTRIAPNLMRPGASVAVPNDEIKLTRHEPVSTMPSGLVDALNPDELRALVAYLVAGTPGE